ncbi:MAG: DHH family phosphoesterase [Planctomycetota bacterium]|nr:DHH family phosphoesterase [Planctomycetota bacterium]
MNAPDPPGAALTGEQRVAALRETLAAAVAESGKDHFLILTHRSPDPDAMGAAVGMLALIERGFGHKATVATLGRIHRAENLAMVRELGLEFEDCEGLDHGPFAGLVLVDTQPSFGHTKIPSDLPVVAIIDHHEPPPLEDASSSEGSPEHGDKPVATYADAWHEDIRVGVGATSSMVFEYLRAAGVVPDARTAGAIFCGVRYDTGDLAEGVTELDQDAWFDCFRMADQSALQRIQRPNLPPEYFSQLASALRSARQHGTMVLGLLGDVVNPEAVAEMADFFVRLDGCRWSLVGGAYEGQYYLSLRTSVGERGAYNLLGMILEGRGSFGGHGRIAGGRVELNDPMDVDLRELERSLRDRVLAMVGKGADGDGPDSELRLGRPLA